jgi:hypothetical protein
MHLKHQMSSSFAPGRGVVASLDADSTNVLTFNALVNPAHPVPQTRRPPSAAEGAGAWPDANDTTEFVGTAPDRRYKVEFTAIAYGIERRFDCRCNDRIAFIAVMSGSYGAAQGGVSTTVSMPSVATVLSAWSAGQRAE